MQQLTREIEPHIQVQGDDYRVTLHGKARPDGIWEGRVAFKPLTVGGEVLETAVETTQPDERGLIRWAEGLSDTFFDGAFRRALAAISRKPEPRRRQHERGRPERCRAVRSRMLPSIRVGQAEPSDNF